VFTDPLGYLRLFNVSIEDTNTLAKNNFTLELSWEALDLATSLSLNGKTARINLPSNFDNKAQIEKKCKVGSTEYTCILTGKKIEFNMTSGSLITS